MDGVPTVCSTPSAVLVFPCGSRSMTSVRSPYIASATPRLTVEVVFPTPPFWLATVMSRILPGGGNGSWSAACSTRVARIASIAMGLSNSPTAWSAERLLRSRSPGSVIGVSSSPPCSTWNGGRVPRGTGCCATRVEWNSVLGGRTTSAAPRHHHHGSGCCAQADTDSPGVDVPHPRRLQLGDERGDLRRRPGADEGDELCAGSQEAAAPADQPGERRDRPRGHHVDRPDRPDDGTLLGPPAHDPPPDAQ